MKISVYTNTRFWHLAEPHVDDGAFPRRITINLYAVGVHCLSLDLIRDDPLVAAGRLKCEKFKMK